ncbi:MAG: LPD28 domain-containing protein, partial [Christensenellaceae bacterium]
MIPIVNARNEEYEYVELFGKPALFTNSRIDRDTVPEGWYAYDLRGSDYDPGEPVTVEPSVVVNHAGTILTHEPISFPKEGFKRLKGSLDFLGEHLSLKNFCEERGLNFPADNRKFILRPALAD